MNFFKALERVKRLIKSFDIEIPEGSFFVRLYHGANQRSNGAWSWEVNGPNGITIVASQWSVGELERIVRTEILHGVRVKLSVYYGRMESTAELMPQKCEEPDDAGSSLP
jgi:hypothetical protein